MRITGRSGFTLIELIVVVAILLVVTAVAIPGLLRAYQAGTEASAVGSLNAINKAQAAYVATCASGYYSPSLTNLGIGPTPTPSHVFISADLGWANSVQKDGYTVTMGNDGLAASAPATCNGLAAGQAASGYHATATANAPTGSRDYGTNTRATIYWRSAAGAPMAMTDTTAPAGAKALQ